MRLHNKIKEYSIRLKDTLSGYDKEVIAKVFRLPNGTLENSFIDKGRDSVQVFPITTNNEVIFVKQFRPGTERIELELPGGGMDGCETPSQAAQRELMEETGYDGYFAYLGSTAYSPYSTGQRHMVLAYDITRMDDGLDLDENEFLEVYKCDLDTVRDMMKERKFRGWDTAYLALDELKKL